MHDITTSSKPETTGHTSTPLVEIKGLTKKFVAGGTLLDKGMGRSARVVTAVDGVDLQIQRGEGVALGGGSGWGKGPLSRSLLRLIEPTAGEVRFDGVNIVDLDP